MRLIISDTAGRETPRRSAMRAWMTSTSSSRSSKIASQYSSNAGCHSGVWYSATAGEPRRLARARGALAIGPWGLPVAVRHA